SLSVPLYSSIPSPNRNLRSSQIVALLRKPLLFDFPFSIASWSLGFGRCRDKLGILFSIRFLLRARIMPAVVEPGSVGSRVRFQERITDSEAGSVDGNGDREAVTGGLPVQRFELREDPSFWKDHNVQVLEAARKYLCKDTIDVSGRTAAKPLLGLDTQSPIREDSRKGVHVETLSEFEVSSARDVMQQLIQVCSNMHQAVVASQYAIVNEDASGDVLSMRLQIQQLKVTQNILLQCSFMESIRRKEYEAALVAAFRRDKDKEDALKAMTAEKQAAEQLATQRTEEVRSLKMRLRFREERIKRLEAVASGKLSAETHLLQEKEELLKEIEALSNQVDRNPEVTRFAMENLQLKEELRRSAIALLFLLDFLLEALDWKLMHEKDSDVVQAIQNQREIEALRKNLSSCLEAKEKLERRVDELGSQLEEQRKSTHAPYEGVELPQTNCDITSGRGKLSDDQIELKTMVDAIAVASQREVEAHETAIALAKENEELRMKLGVLIEDNNKLIELYENAIAEGGNNDAGSLTKVDKSLVQVDMSAEFNEIRPEEFNQEFHCSGKKDIESLEHQLYEMHEENEKLMGLYEKAMKERDDFKRILASMESNMSLTKEEIVCPEKLVEMDEEIGCRKQEAEELKEHLAEVPEKLRHLVRNNLELVRVKLAAVWTDLKYFGILEKNITDLKELSENVEEVEPGIQLKEQEIEELKLVLSQTRERKTVVDNKFLALKRALENFSSEAHYWEQRETRARTRLNVCFEHLEQKKEELRCLQTHKDEISTALSKAQQSEYQLRRNTDCLKSKLHDSETQRKKTERVLFAIDNMDTVDVVPVQKNLSFGKASELLKCEEERSKLSVEMKKLQEQLAVVQKEIASFVKKIDAIDTKMKSYENGIHTGLLSLQEAEVGLQQVMEEKNMLSEMREDGKAELAKLLLEFQECVFVLDLKEGEIQLCRETMQQELTNLEEKKTKRDLATQNLNQFLVTNRSAMVMISDKGVCPGIVSEKLQQELSCVQMYLEEVITSC
ncbi:hypothetical protein BHM03_00027639, partial [Ensete ventricosum]